ncbi:hypothetical protein A3H89_03760 [Candidatus Amesbacteria bacterium RIFCSPLOWO2_02_FULL_48_11]|uniref:Thioredoxin domain-containing protein n=2 Tax=Candidatus Amesiibacteriota TaxID=1752730 RepID=A0A1F5A1G7_9BACT|nr:MAG: VKORC1/thioredoxin domain protein [Candidatus Amesbacteria bacterium GW2011_GWA2_47_11]OGC96971.1 MAG: hypothetical protein A2W16_00495 [Candidatus Amesbacteria bacterium RBG_16_48_31]OGD02982.1 MAG: hypothetical protein A2354_01205 [Candidatus Amesbacteria bacterium RIFOXYB1_FULL_47_12]OGD05550.1 MAG: hypothetical protein A3H89_03760 [Candidatus Amesbacteria bacterium RIFCSPLOWO2_02_FULL_48_11]OGD12188.1 MAG: hypothetical protein A2576_04870 [Candidatus Amesbacteria bacterium RIFOXYD1_
MNKPVIIVVSLVTAAILGGGVILATRPSAPAFTGLDEFAKCLTSKSIVMYGAAWCPHCQQEKKAFGDSFQYVTYVECPANPQACLDKNVTGYPTWILGDGTRLSGQQGIKKLSEASGCALP